MLSGFWDSVTGKLADRFFAISSQALVFWAGGAIAWLVGNGGLSSLDGLERRLATYSAPGQVAVLIVAMLVIAASGIVVQRLTPPVLKLLEGYWPRGLDPLRDKLIKKQETRITAEGDDLQDLAGLVHDGTATRQQRDRYVWLDGRSRRVPRVDRLLPTPIGNTLRAAETRPVDKYGLDAVSLWPHLWLVMPDSARSELAAARAALDASVAAVIWGALFIAFSAWSPWAAAVGIGTALMAVLAWVPARATAFATLAETAFDLYRQHLYAQLRWPLPATPADEQRQGRLLTTYVVRGSDAESPEFTSSTASGAEAS